MLSRILIVTDDRNSRTALNLAKHLNGNGHGALVVVGQDAVLYELKNVQDVTILYGYSDLDGYSLSMSSSVHRLKKIGTAGDIIPMLTTGQMVSARDIIAAGARTCLPVTADYEEIDALVQALRRRKVGAPDGKLGRGQLSVDTATRTVKLGKRTMSLTAEQYAMLEVAAAADGEIVDRKHLVRLLRLPVMDASVGAALVTAMRELKAVLGDVVEIDDKNHLSLIFDRQMPLFPRLPVAMAPVRGKPEKMRTRKPKAKPEPEVSLFDLMAA